jgi:hypothetical protein
MAFTGGPAEFGEILKRFRVGDTLLMWANGLGVVAVGRVTAAWDGVAHRTPLVYREPHEFPEYRIPVDWYLDLRDAPLRRADVGWNPVQAVQRVKGREKLEALLATRLGGARARPLVVFVDIDDTLMRSFGSKRIAMTTMVERVRVLHAEGAVLYAWSSGGAEYARRSAEELGLSGCFVAFLPKPEVFIDDIRVEAWRSVVQLHPNEAAHRSVEELRVLVGASR